jgi:UDP-glucose:(heptosyl)LPS alpha-1,3-glucosyltransferase
MMKLAVVLFHYFPYGGLERDMLAIAGACAAKGHEVIIYTRHWTGRASPLR